MNNETKSAGRSTHPLLGGLAGAVARLGLDADEQRVGLVGLVAQLVLQLGDELERVQRHDAVVVVARGQLARVAKVKKRKKDEAADAKKSAHEGRKLAVTWKHAAD